MSARLYTFGAEVRKTWSLRPHITRAIKLVWRAAPGWTLLWLLLLLAQGLLPVASVYLTRLLVNSMVAVIDNGLESAALRPAILAIAGVVLVRLASTLLGSITGMVLTVQSASIGDYLDNLVHEKAMLIDMSFYDSPDYYNRLYRARYEGSGRPLALVRAFGSLLQNTITLLAMAGVLLQYGLILPLALFASSIPAFFAVLYNRSMLHRWRMRVTSAERRSSYYAWLLTDRMTAAELRLFDLGDFFRDAYQEIRARLRQDQISISRRQGLVELLASLFGLLVMVLALAWMLWQAIQGFVTLGDLALFYQAFNTGQGLMRSLLANVGEIYASTLFLEDFFEFLDLQPRVVDPEEPLLTPSTESITIAFEQVQFYYPDSERAVLDGFDMVLEPDQFVAVVGRNGAGKSTLVKLLTRLYEVDDGRITVNGTDIRALRQSDLRRLITVLFQDPVLYNDTAALNIGYGDLPNATPERIRIASEAAGSDQIIERLPEGYNTLLGKWFIGGTELSIGEWQRLALARAYLRQAPIVILDEPTSAMDPWAEAEWVQRFRQDIQDRTVLLITHRFSTAMYADLIYVMEEGRIVECGTHEELLLLNERYADSWNASRRQREARRQDVPRSNETENGQ